MAKLGESVRFVRFDREPGARTLPGRTVAVAAICVLLIAIASRVPRNDLGAQYVTPGCPHEGRDPTSVYVPPVVSPDYTDCNSITSISGAGVSGSSRSEERCPDWATTGLRYNPAMTKPNRMVTKSREVENIIKYFKCIHVSILFGVASWTKCDVIDEEAFEVQDHIMRDGECPTLSVDPT